MTGKQENKLSMYLALLEVLGMYKAKWESLAAFVNTVDKFENHIGKIREIRKVQETKITGVTREKEKAGERAIHKALIILKAVSAYATDIDDSILEGKVGYSKSDLDNSRDTELTDILNVLFDAATSVVSELGDYGIVQADLDEFRTLIDNYDGISESPRVAITQRSDATQKLDEEFKKTDKVLESSDKLILQFEDTDSVFYQHYKNARQIIDLGVRHKKDDENTEDEPEEEITP